MNRHIANALAFFLTLIVVASPVLLADDKPSDAKRIRVLVWDERQPTQKTAYDNFLGGAIAEYLKSRPGFDVATTCLDDAEQGITDAQLDKTDVLIWWGHVRNREVKREVGQRVVERIKAGKLSLIALHSAHWSWPFVEAMCERAKQDAAKEIADAEQQGIKVTYVGPILTPLKKDDPLTPQLEKKTENGQTKLLLFLPRCIFPSWRADAAPSHVKTLLPDHPIAAGIPREFDIAQTEMYSDPIHVPEPDAVIFEEHWDKGEHFRSGMLWKVGKGQVFYFRPGHEIYPVYKQEFPLKILENATRFLAAK